MSLSSFKKHRLLIDSLESREVPAGNPLPAGLSLDQFGNLNIVGQATDDVATVSLNADGKVHALIGHKVNIQDGAGGVSQIVLTDADKTYEANLVKKVVFYGHEGNDQFTNDTAIPSNAYGQAGSDQLTGGSGVDILIGGEGDDILEGREGNDDLRGGDGNDAYVFSIEANPGGPGLGSDKITEAANLDKDSLFFSDFDSSVSVNLGSTAMQTVHQNLLNLQFTNSLGLEDVWGSSKADKITGNSRANFIYAGVGADSVFAGVGNDTVDGGSGNDSLDGGIGDDSITAGTGNDAVNGASGNDSIDGGDGNDFIDGASGNDLITGGNDNDTIIGGADNDTVYGGYGNDNLAGGTGNDQLNGDFGNDTISGESGNDSLDGGDGNDSLDGGSDKDSLSGGTGDDMLDGGLGRDVLDGGEGDYDSLYADVGNETLSNGEHVEIEVPDGSPQNNNWSCGPNSASRLLRSYGINSATYSALKIEAQKSNIISQYGLGTPPPSLLKVMQKYKVDSQLKSGAQFQDVLDRLGEGRPVLALIGWGEVLVPSPNPFKPLDTAPTKLHYICLTGFDTVNSKIYFTDTNGEAKQMSFSQFQAYWNWPGDGVVYAALSDLGIQKQTMLW